MKAQVRRVLSSPYPVPPSRLWLTVRTIAYALIAASGAAVLSTPPTSYAGLSTVLTVAWGILCLIGGGLMAYGTVRQRYRWEWLPSWVAATGVAMYAALSWHAVLTEGIGHAPRALLMSSLVLLLLSRAIQLGLIDLGARRIAELRGRDD